MLYIFVEVEFNTTGLDFEKLLLISFQTDIWKCEFFLIQTQILWTDSSQCPLSKHVSPLCEQQIIDPLEVLEVV